jgi:hypothetical protein
LWFYIVPFDDHRFQQIFIKLYNRLFTQEEVKYMPPKFSYALKELASDLGIFERADVSSVISSGSTTLSMTTTSGFNLNFNSEPQNSIAAMMLRSERENAQQAFQLSPIKEQLTHNPRAANNSQQQFGRGDPSTGYGRLVKPMTSNNGGSSRFRNMSLNNIP